MTNLLNSSTIVQLCPRLNSGGIERGTVDLAIALKKAGFNSLVISGGGFLEKELADHGVMHIKLPIYSKNPWQFMLNLGSLAKIFTQLKPAIIQPYSRIPAWLVYLIARKHNYYWISNCNGVHSIDKLGIKKWYNAVLTKGQQVVANSEFTKAYLIKNYPVNADKIKVIYRGIDNEKFNPQLFDSANISSLKKQRKIPEGKTVILLPARFSHWKGQFVFIEACRLLKENFQFDFVALLVGNTKNKAYVNTIEDLIRRYHLTEEVKILTEAQQMNQLYAVADIVLSTSIEPEAFGRTIVEAQSMLKAVIAPKHGGACETIDEGKTGWLYPPGDAKALAETIYKVCELSAEQKLQILNNAAQQAKTKFSKTHMCEEYIKLYKDVL